MHFLVVENDPDDAILIGYAFPSVRPRPSWFICRTPGEAKDYLRGAGMYSNRIAYPSPHIIITDFRMGGESGIDLLTWVRSRPALKDIAVVIFSGSGSPEEMSEATQAGAQSVHTKPAKLEDLKKLLQTFMHSI